MNNIPPNADVVVIGSGVAGLGAAATLAGGGARVIIFEKQRSLGGTSNFFHGMFAVESEMQRERYITYSRDQAFKNIMEYSHWRANPRLVRVIVDESAQTIAWLREIGVEFRDATINMPDAPQTYHFLKGRGEVIVKALSDQAKDKAAIFFPGTSVKRILKTGDRITGVIADRDGEETQVTARAVVIACGGYANNKEWIKKYARFDLGVNITPLGNVDKMGDGIRMAWEVGADEEGMGILELLRTGPVGPEFTMGNQVEYAAVQPGLWINQHGERFCDESITFYDTASGNANARQKDGLTYSLFDESFKRRMMEKGVDKAMSLEFPPGRRLVNLDKELSLALSRGTTEIFCEDSIPQLANRIGVDPAVLKATVDEYNGFCEKGYDDLFAKDPKYLWPLKEPKYYAIKAHTLFLGTLGGIKINHKMEVIDKKGKVIPGLYAAGYDAGGMYGDGYSIRDSSGLSSAFALNSGRIAGRNALKYTGK